MLDSVFTSQPEQKPSETTENGAVLLNGLPTSAIRAELAGVLRSRVFVHSHRIRRFLQFVVEECIAGQQHRLKEYLIGLEVFNRQETFDPRVDSIVRVEARRLRAKLEEYYQTEGRDAEIRIELRKGSYVPLFETRRSGHNEHGYAHAAARKKSVAIGRFATPAGAAPEVAVDITRRLTHILVSEGFCQVVTGYDPGLGEQAFDSMAARPDYVIDGTVESQSDDVKIMLQLLDVAQGAYVWSLTGDGSDIDEMARAFNRKLVTSYPQSDSRGPHRHRSQSQSFEHYLHGRYLWKQGSPESIRTSTGAFAKAVEKDPSYAAAWAALAESMFVSSLFGFISPREAGPKIQEAVQKATSLNDSLYEGHVAAGLAASVFEWKWQQGESELQRAVQLDGRDPSVHIAYALQLASRGMLPAALGEVERALDLDPASLTSNFVLGWLRSASKKYDEAIAQHSAVSQLAPDFPLAYLGLGWAYAGKGLFGDALAYFTNAANLLRCRTLLAGCIGYCYARMGNRDEARRQLSFLTSQPPSQYASAVSVAAIHAGLADLDQAFHYLDQAADAHDPALPLQLLNPEFDALKSDPRYQALLVKTGLLPFGAGFARA